MLNIIGLSKSYDGKINACDNINLTIEKGDIFVQYTDGLTEAMDPKEEEYGMERFVDAIQRFGKYDADYLVTKTINTVESFTKGHPQTDDISMIAIKRNDD